MKGIREVNSVLYLKSGETVQMVYKNIREAVAHASNHRRTDVKRSIVTENGRTLYDFKG